MGNIKKWEIVAEVAVEIVAEIAAEAVVAVVWFIGCGGSSKDY